VEDTPLKKAQDLEKNQKKLSNIFTAEALTPISSEAYNVRSTIINARQKSFR
jgi:hypothetical protein